MDSCVPNIVFEAGRFEIRPPHHFPHLPAALQNTTVESFEFFGIPGEGEGEI